MTDQHTPPTVDEPPRQDSEIDPTRRRLLAMAGGVVALSLAPGVSVLARTLAGGKGTGRAQPIRYGLLIDATKCTGKCDACVNACVRYNGLSTDRGPDYSQWIRKVTVTDPKTGSVSRFPVMCQHCAEPACVEVCPTGASFKRSDGIVLVDKHRCIGCRYCMMACPYKARSFVARNLTDQKPWSPRGRGSVEACTLCVERVDKGQIPACVEACGSQGKKAMLFGNLHDPKSEIAKRLAQYPTTTIRADLGMAPGVHYRGI
ncbi:MAG TPA: 4Fe-4S dicluster domain-containing protein [Acidiferrobacter sp.]|nr:4Fe-4S dicluster domain-containing protein [Acidiferrobacter sp.]